MPNTINLYDMFLLTSRLCLAKIVITHTYREQICFKKKSVISMFLALINFLKKSLLISLCLSPDSGKWYSSPITPFSHIMQSLCSSGVYFQRPVSIYSGKFPTSSFPRILLCVLGRLGLIKALGLEASSKSRNVIV